MWALNVFSPTYFFLLGGVPLQLPVSLRFFHVFVFERRVLKCVHVDYFLVFLVVDPLLECISILLNATAYCPDFFLVGNLVLNGIAVKP